MITSDLIIPYSKEAEDAVISTLLFNGNHIEWLSGMLSTEMFHQSNNGEIYAAVKSLHDEGGRIDPVTIAERLEKRGKLKSVGVEAFLKSMADRIVSTSHLE